MVNFSIRFSLYATTMTSVSSNSGVFMGNSARAKVSKGPPYSCTMAVRSLVPSSRLASRDFAGEDVPFDRAQEVFRKLNGTIHLIRGNHDGDEVCEKLPWASVDVMRTLVDSDGR